MSFTLQEFAAACHRSLVESPGVPGREKMRALVEKVLADKEFVTTHFSGKLAERKVLYEDPQFGFCILAHAYEGARNSNPHDHGPSWAIYGQVAGETIMSDWALVEPPKNNQPGKVRFVKDYTLKPGMARLYNEGDLHSPRREKATRLLRIEGTNLEKVRRLPYERVADSDPQQRSAQRLPAAE